MKEYPGKLSDFLYSQKQKGLISENSVKKTSRQKPALKKPRKSQPVPGLSKEINSLKKSIREIDILLHQLQETKKNIELELEMPEVYSQATHLSEVLERLESTNKEIDKKQISWMELYNRLEKLSPNEF